MGAARMKLRSVAAKPSNQAKNDAKAGSSATRAATVARYAAFDHSRSRSNSVASGTRANA